MMSNLLKCRHFGNVLINTRYEKCNRLSSKSFEDSLAVHDILTGLDQDFKKILKQRFFDNMTMVEIGIANGYSRETARRRLKNAIKRCKNNCIS